MSDFEKQLKRFREGKSLTNQQLIDLHDDLVEIIDVLIGKGDLFIASYSLALSEYHRVKSQLVARGIDL